jgi:hypothetical protein
LAYRNALFPLSIASPRCTPGCRQSTAGIAHERRFTNLAKMPELRRCFEALGFGSVATYIQSGNALFEVTPPVDQSMTIGNWNTTVKLRALLDARGEEPAGSPR